jgi:hypothetical protein
LCRFFVLFLCRFVNFFRSKAPQYLFSQIPHGEFPTEPAGRRFPSCTEGIYPMILTQRHGGHNGTAGGKEKDMRSEVCSPNVVYTNKFDTTIPYSSLRAFVPLCRCANFFGSKAASEIPCDPSRQTRRAVIQVLLVSLILPYLYRSTHVHCGLKQGYCPLIDTTAKMV